MDQINVLKALEKNKIHRDYLDKLFQCIIRIPLSQKYDSFIENIVSKYFLKKDRKVGFATMLSEILEKNPRKVKNFLNSFKAYWELQNKQTEDELDICISALFHYLRIYHEQIFTILERKPEYIIHLVNVCKKEAPNRKIELMLSEYLKNPIVEEIDMEAVSETKTLTPAKITKEELQQMENRLLNYEALEKFIEYFRKHCENITTDSLNQYLAIIKD